MSKATTYVRTLVINSDTVRVANQLFLCWPENTKSRGKYHRLANYQDGPTQTTFAYFLRSSITVWLISKLTNLDLVALLNKNSNTFSTLVNLI